MSNASVVALDLSSLAWANQDAAWLAQSLFSSAQSDSSHVIEVAGVAPEVGTSTVTAALSRYIAENFNESVCVVEVKPAGSNGSGSIYKIDQKNSSAASGREQKFVSFLSVKLGGGTNSENLERVAEVVNSLRNSYRFVFLDVPALSSSGDGVALGRISDGTILVLEADKTRRHVARRLVASLRASSISILGVVLNKRKFPIPASIYQRL